MFIGKASRNVCLHSCLQPWVERFVQECIKGKSLQLRPFCRRAEFASATKNRPGQIGLDLLGRMAAAFACSEACSLLLAQSPGVEFVQAQCCSDDAGQSLALLFHDIRPQMLTIIKIPDMVATSHFFTHLLHQFFCLCLLQFSCHRLYLYLPQQSRLLFALHRHCSSPVARRVA